MKSKPKRQLKKLNSKQFIEDIKKYLKSPYEFYGIKVPEIKILAARLHEEHNLKNFYAVFNKLLKSGYPEETALAIYTLQLYKKEFSIKTWKFLKLKLKEIKSVDQIDIIGTDVLGELLLKSLKFKSEILKLAKSSNILFKRMAIMSLLPLVQKGEIDLAMKLIKENISNRDECIQKAIGFVLNEASRQKSRIIKKFIIDNQDMPLNTFIYSTEYLTDLRKLRQLKKITPDKFKKIFFWRN